MIRRTPLELAIATKTERNSRYEQKLRELGMVKVTVWCSPELGERIRELAAEDRKDRQERAAP